MTTANLTTNAAGDETTWADPFEVGNYEAVRLTTDNTYVATDSTSLQNDLYNITTTTVDGAITSVKVYYECKYYASGSGSNPASAPVVYPIIRTGSTTVVADTGTTTTTSFQLASYEWTTNPVTESAWVQDDIDALQIGVRSKTEAGGGSKKWEAQVEYVYAVVTYTSPVTLVIADSSHAHTAEALALVVPKTLVIADSRHTHTADGLTLDGVDLNGKRNHNSEKWWALYMALHKKRHK